MGAAAAGSGGLPLSIGLAALPPGHPALAHIQQQMHAAMQAQQNVNVAQAMVQAAAQAAAAGVPLPPGLQAQLQAQQQYQQVAAAAAAAAAVQQQQQTAAGVPPPQASPAVVASAPQPPSAQNPSAAANAAAAAAAAAATATANQTAVASSGVAQTQEQQVAVGENEWAAEPLFGGAMEMELPLRFKDISKYRPVPDHQEVGSHHHMHLLWPPNYASSTRQPLLPTGQHLCTGLNVHTVTPFIHYQLQMVCETWFYFFYALSIEAGGHSFRKGPGGGGGGHEQLRNSPCLGTRTGLC